MSDIFKASVQKPKRDWFDWLADNFGKVAIAVILCNVLFWGTLAYLVASHAHDIAREAGSIAKSAADGYANTKPK